MTFNTWVKKEKIKTLLIRIIRILIRTLYFLPLKDNRIVFFSFQGKQYSCNPKAISVYLQTEYPGKYEIIWAFNDTKKHSYLKKKGIKIVKYKSFKRVLLQISAKYCINNTGSFSWIPLRKGQHHINTWHAGGAYKRLQHDSNADFNRKMTTRETSLMISSCELFTKTNIRFQFGYQKKVLGIGMPRNDVFFDIDATNKRSVYVRRFYKLDKNDLVVLYAPTWRYDGNIPCFDLKKVEDFLSAKFGRHVVIMIRNHNLSSVQYNNILDVSSYEDMQDLLCAADILITDYSSSIWDYSFTYRPCFLFVPDLGKYITEQGFYTDINTWGFPICRDNAELINEIENFDSNDFVKKMNDHHIRFGSYEKGTATKVFCEKVFGKGER